MKKIFFILFLLESLLSSQVTLSQMTPCSLTPLPLQNIILDWPDYPGALTYQLQISTDEVFLTLIVNVSGLTQSQYTVPNVLSYYTCYYWRWRPVLQTGNGPWSQICRFCTAGPTGIKITSIEIPAEYNLYQNYPNPFNPETIISFDVPKQGNINLTIYSITGEQLEVIVNEIMIPGMYEVSWNASEYSGGIYVYTLIAEKFNQAKKMVLIK